MSIEKTSGQEGTRGGGVGTEGLRVGARLVVRFPDAEACSRAKRALEPESKGFLVLQEDGTRLLLEAPEASVGRLLATVDDALACLQVAWEAEHAAGSPGGSERGSKSGSG